MLHFAKSFDVLSVSLMLTKLERLDFELFTKLSKLKVVKTHLKISIHVRVLYELLKFVKLLNHSGRTIQDFCIDAFLGIYLFN